VQRFNTTAPTILEMNPGLNPDNLAVGQQICVPQYRLIYLNRQYRMILVYPANWHKVTEDKYEGPEGFFQISAAGGNTLDEVCHNETTQLLKPYGSNPTISKATINGQQACYILPSSDQPVDMKHQTALIIRYPRPVTLSSQTYSFLVIWSDKEHINSIAVTVEFLP
jgi:TolB protein